MLLLLNNFMNSGQEMQLDDQRLIEGDSTRIGIHSRAVEEQEYQRNIQGLPRPWRSNAHGGGAESYFERHLGARWPFISSSAQG